uniref:Uncharacterized protein n=1 Tax=Magallana gigas TaxID=29159 RepID=A0A8W8KFF3_MAGGI
MNEDTVEQEPFLRNETKDSSESPPTIKHEDENITGARKSGHSDASDPADMNESDDLSEHFGDALSSPTNIKQKNSEVSTGDYDGLRTIEVDSNICKSAYVDISKDLKEGVSTTDEQDVELCLELYKLLDTEGRKLMQEVMAATITRETGKSVKTLKEQEKNKLKAMLPEESHRVLESITEHDTSIHVSYGLHRIILDEEKSPKSGWGNPVRETDTSIGDDVERLYRIQTIVQRISNPVTLSVESYIRLLDIMIKALIRLDHDVLTVSNRVLSQLRLVVNTTCLKLAKPSNQQLRLSCRQYDYHCLLDETFTKEFEVCREWRWIFEEIENYSLKLSIFESKYVRKKLNVSARSSWYVDCADTAGCGLGSTAGFPKKFSTSVYLVPSHVQSRLLVETTCLELAKPSNKQLRLSCSNPNDYHCLLDESYTQEYEACREWKWIPGDTEECIRQIELIDA